MQKEYTNADLLVSANEFIDVQIRCTNSAGYSSKTQYPVFWVVGRALELHERDNK